MAMQLRKTFGRLCGAVSRSRAFCTAQLDIPIYEYNLVDGKKFLDFETTTKEERLALKQKAVGTFIKDVIRPKEWEFLTSIDDPENYCMAKFWTTYDKNGDGGISVDEWAEAVWDLGSNASREAIERLFYTIDTNNDGMLDLSEILNFLKGLAVRVGMIRLDYYYDENVGDAAHPTSHALELVEERIPGLTFEACQHGVWNEQIEEGFKRAIANLEEKNCMIITGDCGFMAHYQNRIEKMTKIQVSMSTLCFLQDINRLTKHQGNMALVTANAKSLKAGLKEVCENIYGTYNPEWLSNYVIIGLEEVLHFGDEIAAGEKINCVKAEREILRYIDKLHEEYDFKGFLLECTELPQFADAIRIRYRCPVYDCITMVRRFCNTRVPNANFGVAKEIQDIYLRFRETRREGIFVKIMDLKARRMEPVSH